MSTIKSSNEHLTLNADGSGKDIKFQSNGSQVASISDGGVVTATSFAGSGANLTNIPATDISGKLNLSGGTMTGNIVGGDNIKLQLGDNGGNPCLEIFHDNSNSYVKDVGPGSLILNTDGNNIQITSGSSEVMAQFNKDGASDLYHNGTKRLFTLDNGSETNGTHTAHNITVTQNAVIGVISDNAERSLTINSSSDSLLRIKTQNDNEVGAVYFGNSTAAVDGRIQYDARRMRFWTAGVNRFELTADGRGLSQFTAKAWCNGNFNDGTPDIQDSFNVSSVEYMGSTGYFGVYWDVDTGNGDYASFINCYSEVATQTGYVDAGFAQNSSYLRFQFYRNGSLYNPAEGHLIIFGD